MNPWGAFSLGNKAFTQQGRISQTIDCQAVSGEHIGEKRLFAPVSRNTTPKDTMLTDVQCRNATCSVDKKRAHLTDGAGLYLEISPAGAKRWFPKIYKDGKETRLALGSYPTVSLTAACLTQKTPFDVPGA